MPAIRFRSRPVTGMEHTLELYPQTGTQLDEYPVQVRVKVRDSYAIELTAELDGSILRAELTPVTTRPGIAGITDPIGGDPECSGIEMEAWLDYIRRGGDHMTAGLQHKLRSQKGETLIELLVSILIAALSVGMLMTGVTVSSRLNQAAQERDAVFYQLLTKAESRQDPITTGSVSPGVRIQEGRQVIYGTGAALWR